MYILFLIQSILQQCRSAAVCRAIEPASACRHGAGSYEWEGRYVLHPHWSAGWRDRLETALGCAVNAEAQFWHGAVSITSAVLLAAAHVLRPTVSFLFWKNVFNDVWCDFGRPWVEEVVRVLGNKAVQALHFLNVNFSQAIIVEMWHSLVLRCLGRGYTQWWWPSVCLSVHLFVCCLGCRGTQ